MTRTSTIARQAAALLLFLCSSLAAQAAANWTPPVDVSQASQPASALATLVDRHGNEHLVFEAVTEYQVGEILHTYRPPGGDWSEPTQISNTGYGATFPNPPGYPFFMEDAFGRLHLLFESLEGIPGTVQVWHTMLQTSSPGAGWTTPTNVSQASQPARAEAALIDSNGTLHLVFSAIPGLGTTQLFHAYRPVGGPWSEPTQVSNNEQGVSFPTPSPQYHFFMEDASGQLHLFFEAIPGLGVLQVWHAQLDIESPGGGWTSPANVSQASQPARAQATVVDSKGTLHLVFRAIPGLGTLQLFHAFRPAGGLWSSPTQITHTGYVASLCDRRNNSSFVVEDGAGQLHLFFESIGSFGFQQVWQTDLDTSSPGAGWSDAVDVSRYPRLATAEALTLDENGSLHLVFGAVPPFGTHQLFHSYRLPGQSFSLPTQVSHTGQSANPADPGPTYSFLEADGRGALHLFFRSVPGLGVAQLWHTELSTADPAAGWSDATNITHSSQPAFAEAYVIDATGALHVVFTAIPGLGTIQVFHVERPSGGEWTTPTMVSHSEQGARIAFGWNNYRFVHEHDGNLHLSFEAIPDALGVEQVWHSELSLDPSILRRRLRERRYLALVRRRAVGRPVSRRGAPLDAGGAPMRLDPGRNGSGRHEVSRDPLLLTLPLEPSALRPASPGSPPNRPL